MAERLAQLAAIKRATLAAQRGMDSLDAETQAALEKLYRQAAAEIRARIAAFGGGDGNVTLAQLQDVLGQVNGRLAMLSDARDRMLEGGLQQAAALGVQPLTAAGLGVSVSPVMDAYAAMQVSDEALRIVRTFIAEGGLQLSDRIWRLDRQARDLVGNAIEMAVIQGHGAGQAARDLLQRGLPVPPDIAGKMNAGNAEGIGKAAADALTGSGGPMDNAMRVMRTEINRAHGEAYMAGGEKHPDFGGWRFLLSPAHPKPDICDLHASANLHGLGRGVYPNRAKCPWPAHPNTLSYVEIVFKDEITAGDRNGKETTIAALDRLTPAQQRGVLGAHKQQAHKDGKLTQGMIKAPWQQVKKRIGDLIVSAPVVRQKIAQVVSSVSEMLDWMRDNLSPVVRFPGASLEQLRSIRKGMEAVLGEHKIKLGELVWIPGGHHKANAYYRHYLFTHQPGVNDSIRFDKQYAFQAPARARAAHATFLAKHRQRIDEYKAALQRPGISPQYAHTLEARLAREKVIKRWSASSVADDPLFVTSAHESGHAVYFQSPKIEATWKRELMRENVSKIDMLKVSEYGESKVEELFAEVTALIADGKRSEVPDNILRAFDAAMKWVK